MIDFLRIHDLINKHNSFLITTHINPDGDAIGSELALYRFLISIGKEANIINHSSTPGNMKFLDPEVIIKSLESGMMLNDVSMYEAIIIVDLNQLNRTGDLEDVIRDSGLDIICIDHHQNPEEFTPHLFIDTSYGSTGEILFDLFELSKNFELTYEIALPLYTAVLTDSGSFKYERTKPETHLKAAKLLSVGIDPKKVYSQIYDQGNLEKIKLLARALNSIELHHSGKVAAMKITRKDFNETLTNESDTESFVNYLLTLKGVEIGFFMYEMESGVKVSFRSVGQIPVNKLAGEFGGGGHINAAATRINDDIIENVLTGILRAAGKYIK